MLLPHIGHLYIADGAAGRELLELRLEGQLSECVDLLAHMDMVGIGDIGLVRDRPGDDPETVLKALGKR